MAKPDANYVQTTWSLEELFPASDSAEMKEAWQEVEELVVEFEGLRPRLTADIGLEEFLGLISRIEEMTLRLYRIYGYAGLRFAENTQNQDAQTLTARVNQFVATVKNRILFFDLWWKGLDEDNTQRLMAGAGDFGYWLEEMRHFKPYTLSEPEEKIINIKDVTGTSALQTLYDTITNRYVFELVVDGDAKELTRDELSVYSHHHDGDLRAGAYQELYRVYQQDAPVLGQIYQTLTRDWRNEQVNLRRFSSPMSVRNLANDLPDEVVDTLLGVCKQNTSLFRRFFDLKARWLGMDRLRRYDIYAPVAKTDKSYDFDTAVNLVLEAFGRFDPNLADMAQQILDKNHLDSEVRKGKRSGAFCWTVSPDLTPWVLTNYQGRPRDVGTLAHELGHAVHSLLASHRNVFTFHPALPLAETASTFGEMLLIDLLLSQETDDSVRRDLLFEQIDDAYATIMRQAFFATFERNAHDLTHKGSSIDALADSYYENLEQQFGTSVDIGEEFRWEWVSIPHIYHVPFYVYAYAFGQLLVFSLYEQYAIEGEDFRPRYLKVLAAGGSNSPGQILGEAGIDIRQEAFWQGGFNVIQGLIERLESIPVDKTNLSGGV